MDLHEESKCEQPASIAIDQEPAPEESKRPVSHESESNVNDAHEEINGEEEEEKETEVQQDKMSLIETLVQKQYSKVPKMPEPVW